MLLRLTSHVPHRGDRSCETEPACDSSTHVLGFHKFDSRLEHLVQQVPAQSVVVQHCGRAAQDVNTMHPTCSLPSLKPPSRGENLDFFSFSHQDRSIPCRSASCMMRVQHIRISAIQRHSPLQAKTGRPRKRLFSEGILLHITCV